MKKLFFIESGEFMRQTIEKTLTGKGWQVYSSEGGEDSLYLVKDLRPDLVLLDVNSLEKQGPEFFKYLATQIPVVFMGSETDKELASTFACPSRGYLLKPISPTQLEEKLLLFLHEDKG